MQLREVAAAADLQQGVARLVYRVGAEEEAQRLFFFGQRLPQIPGFFRVHDEARRLVAAAVAKEAEHVALSLVAVAVVLFGQFDGLFDGGKERAAVRLDVVKGAGADEGF